MLRSISWRRYPLDISRLNAPIHACLFLHGKGMGQEKGELREGMEVVWVGLGPDVTATV